MSDIKVDGFKSSELLASVAQGFSQLSDTERKAQIKKTNGIFQLNIKNADGTEAVWTIDMKQEGTLYKGEPKSKADVTIITSDETLLDIAQGKMDGQKAYMTGKLKTKGNMMFATKLGGVLSSAKPKAKL